MAGGALSGVRVLEFGHYIAGPRCAQILADHGADVVKVEPLTGDPSRNAQPRHQGVSIYFATHNRGKRSCALDLKRDAGSAVRRRLLAAADVLVTNLSPTTAGRLGLDFAAATAANPRLVVVQISAYGTTGSARDQVGYDGTIQARSGIADLTGPVDGPPTVTQVLLDDHLAAVEGALGAVLALRMREATGRGQLVDVSMMDVALSILAHNYGDILLNGARPTRNGRRPPHALASGYETAHGWVYVAPMSAEMWSAVCAIIGRPDWAAPGARYLDNDVRLQERETIEAAINDWTRQHTRAEVAAAMGAAGVPSAPINRLDEALAEPSTSERRMVQWVDVEGAQAGAVPVPGPELKVGEAPPQVPTRVPALGADTRAVLEEAGFTPTEVDRLFAEGVVA